MSIEPILSLLQSKGVSIVSYKPVSGGDINAAYCLTTDSGKLFLKSNSSSKFPDMFLREQEGLEAIRSTGTIAVPNVLVTGSEGDQSFLLMEWVNARSGTAAEMFALGGRLAAMHKHTSTNFGWSTSNYIGSLVQVNDQTDNWTEFFITKRLQPMVEMAVDRHLLNVTDVNDFDRLYKIIPMLFAVEPPALLHGRFMERKLYDRYRRHTLPNRPRGLLRPPRNGYSHDDAVRRVQR